MLLLRFLVFIALLYSPVLYAQPYNYIEYGREDNISGQVVDEVEIEGDPNRLMSAEEWQTYIEGINQGTATDEGAVE